MSVSIDIKLGRFINFGRISHVELHPDTAPAVIRERHITDVRHAVAVLGTHDVATLSDWTCLPAWNVRRALHELGLVLIPDYGGKLKCRAAQVHKAITAAMGERWWGPTQLAREVKMPLGAIRLWIDKNRERLERMDRGAPLGASRNVFYRVKTGGRS